jgi:hypothetical protein
LGPSETFKIKGRFAHEVGCIEGYVVCGVKEIRDTDFGEDIIKEGNGGVV